MYPSSIENFYMSLIKDNKVHIDKEFNKIIIEGLIKNPKETIIKNNKYVTISHKGKNIFLLRFMYMYYTNDYIPKDICIYPIDGDGFNYDFNNIKLVSKEANIKKLSNSGKYTRTNEQKAMAVKCCGKIDIKSVEFYRCQYHQRKLTKQEIMDKTKLSRKTVDNFLCFKTFSFDPITGEYDPSLKDLYTTKTNSKTKRYPRLKKNIISIDESIKNKQFKLPLNFDDTSSIYILHVRKKFSYKYISKQTNIGINTLRRYVSMYIFYLYIFPNHELMANEERNESFHKFIMKYSKYFYNSTSPSIRPYSFKLFISNIDTKIISSIYRKYRDENTPLEELSNEFKIDILKVKFSIIEYDRYLRPLSEERLSPDQFNKVYK